MCWKCECFTSAIYFWVILLVISSVNAIGFFSICSLLRGPAFTFIGALLYSFFFQFLFFVFVFLQFFFCIRFWWCVFVHTHRHRQDFYCTLHTEEENYPTKEEDNMEKRKDRKEEIRVANHNWDSREKCFFEELLLVCLKSNYRFLLFQTIMVLEPWLRKTHPFIKMLPCQTN